MTDGTKCVACGKSIPEDSPFGSCVQCLAKVAFGRGDAETSTLPVAEVQELFPNLVILDRLGRGATGWVFRARQPDLQRDVALKLLPADLPDGNGSLAERFILEARTLARLHHPNVVTVHDSGRAGGWLYLLLEYVPGGNLRKLIDREQLPTVRILEMAGQVCQALEYGHREGIIHRDVKPENLLVDDQGSLKLADFGLARSSGLGLSEPGLFASSGGLGTAYYAAPEQADGKKVDHRADLYSLGVVMYEMLTGELPVGHFRAPSVRRAEARGEVDRIVLKALQSDVSLRYQSAGDMKRDLDRARDKYRRGEEGGIEEHAGAES
ncbi:MAG: serine/threonine protein kinase, partial [Planctomycetota bacterium]